VTPAPLRALAPRVITAEELLWTGRTGVCTVFPAARVDRTGELRIACADGTDADRLGRLFRDPGYDSAPVSFARLNDILVDPALGVAAPRSGPLIAETVFVAAQIDPGLRAIRAALAGGEAAVVTSPVLHCFHRATPAYGHFVYDCLAVIAWFRDAILAGRLQVLVPRYFPDWGLDILACLGLDPARHVIRPADDAVLLCRDVVIPTGIDTANTTHPNGAACAALRAALAGMASPSGARHIYLSRADQVTYSTRAIDNEGAVQGVLARMGVAILQPGNMTFPAQMAAFGGAEVIVGGHGSSFANLFAARPATAVVDLMPNDWIGFWDKTPHERWVLHMTALFGLDHATILCRSALVDFAASDDAATRRGKGMRYAVDLDLLKRVVGRAQDRRRRPAAD
jgi:hypothetical protein